ncbi:UDP-N-acetylglucosamine 2-epimerase (non-hydrolyzing) [Candidatus Woesearchaeota archaeon]|nr:UDP-N-acetylglucosamine 2-epimerase (non-hydrolyzing) [Candidatus Woesearchaeota archaeon]
MKVITVLGTRPEIIKLSPVIDLLENDLSIEHKIIHTGQHYDFNMDKIFFEELKLPKPAFMLDIGSLSRDEQLQMMEEKIEPILNREKPDLVLVLGDTNSTLAGARAARKCGVRLMHIEAGCRSFNEAMPEEMNRIEVDRIADYLIAPDTVAVGNLTREQYPSSKIYHFGSTAYDAVARNRVFVDLQILANLGLGPGSFVLVTVHRAENTEEPNFTQIIESLKVISQSEILVFPVHPRTQKVITEKGVVFNENVVLIEPQSYLQFLALLSSCTFCITDSGGVQEEAVALNTPCLIPRNETEWMRPIYDGKNILAGTTTEKIVTAYATYFKSSGIKDLKRKRHDFYLGASEKIVREIKKGRVHPTAEVSPAAIIGNVVSIWHHAQVREEAVIGDNCMLGKNVYVDRGVVIGNHCRIQNNSSLYRGVTLENGVFIGPHVVLTNDKNPRAINLGGVPKKETDWIVGKILVKEGASLGARVVVLPDVTIGRFALVGAGSVVTRNVPAFGLVYGNPARLQGFVCRCGNKLSSGKRAGDNCEKCAVG